MLRDYKNWKKDNILIVHDVEHKRHFFRPLTENELHDRSYIEKKVRDYDTEI